MVTKSWTVDQPNRGAKSRLLRRAMLPVIGVGIVLLVGGVYGAWRVHRLHQRGNEILSENVSSIRTAEELETVSHELRYRLKRFVSTANARHLEEIASLVPQGRSWLDEAERLAKTSREQQLIERVARGYQRLVTDFQRLLAATSGAAQSQLAVNLADEVIPNKILVYTQKYTELNEQELDQSRERNQLTANRLMFGLLLLGTCGAGAGLLTGYAIARGVNRTIVQLSLPIRDTAGKLNKVVGPVSVSAHPSFQDLESILKTVSERVSTVVEWLQENEREMLRAEQLAAVGQLAAGLAHELRNPLTSVKTILQLADAPEDLSDRDLDVLEQEITRLEGSVQTFLDFARPPQLAKRVVELNHLLDETAKLVARRAEQQGIHLAHGVPGGRIAVKADATQMRQVVLNLLLNAFDAVAHGGTVWLQAAVENGQTAGSHGRSNNLQSRWAVLEISDNGTGLPQQFGDRIFDPFVSTKESGTGLGLSICKRILEAHGGEISAANRPDNGAVFTVRLPLTNHWALTCTDDVHAEALDCG